MVSTLESKGFVSGYRLIDEEGYDNGAAVFYTESHYAVLPNGNVWVITGVDANDMRFSPPGKEWRPSVHPASWIAEHAEYLGNFPDPIANPEAYAPPPQPRGRIVRGGRIIRGAE